ncbi:hypothetical protein T05_5404 [Trichinella murrelli]|uniref:Uncharacterized protein n=1 Tax=Trichinella murrelli TaxID=144512 RepID=A0A0V0UBM3_9BILA|nr:hypothetical protein T05_5404 [Trichinella murrelli]
MPNPGHCTAVAAYSERYKKNQIIPLNSFMRLFCDYAADINDRRLKQHKEKLLNVVPFSTNWNSSISDTTKWKLNLERLTYICCRLYSLLELHGSTIPPASKMLNSASGRWMSCLNSSVY